VRTRCPARRFLSSCAAKFPSFPSALSKNTGSSYPKQRCLAVSRHRLRAPAPLLCARPAAVSTRRWFAYGKLDTHLLPRTLVGLSASVWCLCCRRNVGTGGLCSKCYRSQQAEQQKQQQTVQALAQSVVAPPAPAPAQPAAESVPEPVAPVPQPAEAAASSSPSVSASPAAPAPPKPSSTRCLTCNKKVRAGSQLPGATNRVTGGATGPGH
jgi:hypothetical protein